MKPTAAGSAGGLRVRQPEWEVRTGQFEDNDIEVAAAHLHGMLDAPR